MLTDRIGFMSQGKLEEKLVFRSQKMGALSALTQLVLWCVGMIVLGFTGGWNSATWRDIGDFQRDIEGAGMAKKTEERLGRLLENLETNNLSKKE